MSCIGKPKPLSLRGPLELKHFKVTLKIVQVKSDEFPPQQLWLWFVGAPTKAPPRKSKNVSNASFRRDVMAAMMVFQSKETAAMLEKEPNSLGIEDCLYANLFFCFSRPLRLVVR